MIYQEPDAEKSDNFVWDTQSINILVSDSTLVENCKRAYAQGHRYYITTVQERELKGVPDRKMNYDDPGAWYPPQTDAFKVMEQLNFRRLSCVTHLYPNFWVLDGSMRILDDSMPFGPRIEMFFEIYNNNMSHKRDATIAEATVYHGCTLITKDSRLCKKVNKFYRGSAMSLLEYKKAISAF